LGKKEIQKVIIEYIPRGEILSIEPFCEIFPIEKEVLNKVVADIKEHGYDQNFPVTVWPHDGKLICIDGHTRLVAAEIAGIDWIPVFKRGFLGDEDEAIRYVIHCQRDRRNMTDADIAWCIEAVDKLKGKGERTDLASLDARSGKSAQETAEIVGTSERKVEKYRTVMTHADDETKAAVKSGEKSINRAYTETQQKRKEKEVIQKEQPENQNDNKFWKGILKSIKFLNRKISKGGKYPAKIKSAIKSEILFEFNTLNILITRLENEKKN